MYSMLICYEEVAMCSCRYMIKFILIVIVFVILLLPGTVILAQDFGPCSGDVMKFCKGVQPGQGDISRCLTQNRQSLSDGCQTRLSSLSEQVNEADQACHDDVMLFCSGVKPGGGRIVQCLKDNGSSVSFNCRVKMGLIGFQNPDNKE
jgi:hypothetical protein